MHYHVWFVTKYRKSNIIGEIEKKVKDIFLEVSNNKKYNMLEIETNRDHVHVLLEAESKQELSSMVRTLKAVSANKILESSPLYVRSRDKGRHFWAKRYGYREMGEKDIRTIREYIRNQKNIPHG